MADEQGDLIFPMRLEVDPSKFKSGWDKIEPELQKIIDAKPLKVKLDIDDIATNKIKAAVSKQAKETEEVVENSIKAIQREMKAMTGASENLDIFGDTKAIDALIQKSRDLKNTINEVKTAALPLKDILSIGGKTPTGLDLKRQKDELQRFISLEKEGSRDAIVANEKLIQVKERLRNMYGKQESALKATDEEKKVNETIVAYKRLSAELDKINARIRIRESIKSGSIIAPSSVSASSMGTKTEAEMYNGISQAMDRYKTSLSAVNQEKLKATPSEASKSEIALGNQNLYIQTKVEEAARRASAEQTKLWSKYGQVLKGPENTIYQIQKKLDLIASTRADLKMNPAQIKEADTAVAALKQKLDGLKMPASATGQMANLSKQWSALSAQERKGVAGKDIIEKYRLIDKAAGGASGTLRNAALKTDQFSTSLNKNSQALKSQRGIMNGMPQFINSYISVLGAYRLSQNIVQTTAEFEMQRVALAAIIQDKSKADELFAKDVELGLKSPFQIKELITATKQLSAFRIETDKLFDTTKRLADISAGLGVGMDRLILAYGQVKAASVLRGQELRQFTEAGIPLVEMLADKFNQLRGNVDGLNGDLVTTGDVFKLISERGVSFGMVRDIFEELTSAGGMFFNMQEIQAETLRGSLSNLRDAYDRMFMQIGDANMGPLKAGIDAARSLMENWRNVNLVLSPAIMALVAYNVSLKITSATIGKATLLNLIFRKSIAGVTTESLLLDKAIRYETIGKIKSSRATVAAAMANNVFTKSFYLLKAAYLANPIGFWVVGLTTAAAAIWGLVEAMKFAKSESELLNESLLKSTTEIKAGADLSVMNLDMLVAKLKDATKGSQEYEDIIKKINNIAGPHLQKNLDAAASYDEVAKAAKSAAAAIREAAKAKAYEAGMQMIETDYSARMTKAYTKSQKGLTEKGFTRAQASAITQQISGDIIENPEKYKKSADLVRLITEKIGKAAEVAGIKMIDFGDSSDDAIADIRNGFGKLIDLQDESKQATQDFLDTLNKSGTPLSGYSLALSDIEKKYKSTMESIKKTGVGMNEMGQPTNRATAEFVAQKDRLEELIDAHFRFNQTSPWRKATQELEKLNAKGKDWETTVDKMTTGTGVMVQGSLGAGAAKFSRSQSESGNESYLDYVSRLQSEYATLYEVQAKIKKNGSMMPKSDREALAKDIEMLKKLATAIGWTLEDPNAKKTKTTDSRIATLSNQLKVLREAYSKYNKLRTTIGNEAAKSEVEGLYGGLMAGVKIDKVPELREGLKIAFTEADLSSASKILEKGFGQLGTDATDELRSAVLARTDSSFDEIADNFKRNLDQMGRKIEQTQRANEFFEKMLGLTGSEEAAARITKAMGMIAGDVRSGIKSSLASILGDDYMKGTDLSNASSTQNAINQMRADGFEISADAAQTQLDTLIDYNQKQLELILDSTEDFMSAEDRKKKIALDTQREIARIMAMPDNILSPAEKQTRVTAATKLGTTKSAGVDLEVLQGTELYIKAFEDLDAVSNATLVKIIGELQKLADSGKLGATELKTVVDQIDKAKKTMESNSPFATLTISVKEYKAALIELHRVQADSSSTAEQLAAAQDKVKAALSKTKRSMETLQSNFGEVAGSINDVIDLSRKVAEQFGITFSDETEEYIKAFTGGIEIATAAIGVMVGVVIILEALLWPLLVVALAIGAAFVTFKVLDNLINKGTADKIKANADMIAALNERLKQLADAEDDVIGKMYVKNINDQIKATEELIALEKSNIEANKNGKHFLWWSWSDDEAIKESKDKISEYYNDIEGLREDFMQEMTGYSGSIDAAYSFANSWYDAYLSSADTFDAISEKFDEMIDSMIVKSLLAAATEAKLAPIFTMIQDAYKDGIMTPEELAAIQNATAAVTVTLDPELRGIMDAVYAGGVKPAADKTSLSGISAAVSSMSEDTANTLGGYLNSGLMQWVKQTGLQNRIALAVEANNVQKPLADIYALQAASLAGINAIKSDTAIMVSRLTTIMEAQSDSMKNGGQKAINVRLLN